MRVRNFVITVILTAAGICCSLGSFLYALDASASDRSDTVLIATGDWPPYVSDNGGAQGLAYDIVEAVFRDMKIPFRSGFYPWKRAQLMAEKGDAWASYPYFETEERKKTFLFSDPLFRSSMKYFYYEGHRVTKDTPCASLDDLKRFRFAGVLGYFYAETFKNKGFDVVWVGCSDEAVRLLRSGGVDLMVEDPLVAVSFFRRQFPSDVPRFRSLGFVFNSDPMYLLVSKSYPGSEDLLRRFNASLLRIKKSGEYGKILSKYGKDSSN